jgi:phage gp36-like protein
MAYSTLDDIEAQISEAKLIQLTDDDQSAVDESIVNKAIADADSTINSYVAKAYTVPVVPTPSKLNQLSVTIALYNLFSRRASNVGGVNEVIRINYEDAIAFLERVAMGKATIGVAPAAAPAKSTGGSVSGEKRVFGGNSLRKL